MKMKFMFCVLLIIALMLVLPACNAHHERTESEMQEDIRMNDSWFDDCGLEIESITIEKRQTNKEDKVDYVWVDVLASNSDFSYHANYQLTYYLYNDGWLLEDYEEGSHEITPKNYPTVSEAEAAIRSYYDNCTYVNAVYDDLTVEFQFDWENTENCLTTWYDLFLTYNFSVFDGWKGEITKEERDFQPDIVGEWIYEDQIDGPDNKHYEKSHYYYLNILSLEGEEITFEYDFKKVTRKYHDFEWHDEVVSQASIEPVTARLIYTATKNPYKDYFIDMDFDGGEEFYVNTYFTIWVHVGEGLDFEPGPSCEGHGLHRVDQE